jgi:UDP-N-acetylmuramate dehydrogenase
MSRLVIKNIPLAAHTTLQIGGVADYFAEVTTTKELQEALQFAQAQAVPVFVLGGGSNVLFPDAGYRGLVIKNSIVQRQVDVDGEMVQVTAGAGENWDEFVSDMCEHGYWGIENLSAIPGTVGATPIQNVGAYGVEVSQVITQVTAIHKETVQEKQFTPAECQFGYRDSYFKSPAGKQWVVTAVMCTLSTSPAPQLQYADLQALQTQEPLTPLAIRQAVMQIRAQKFPDWSEVGTAGSFFKNPIVTAEHYTRLKEQYPDLSAHQTSGGDWKLSLGWILDVVCGLKGSCVGGVCLYEKQALVLTATDATAADVQKFVALVTQNVFEKTDIHIEPEVLLVKSEMPENIIPTLE